MPKNTDTDPITDQEMAYAHLIMSGTMNDRRAAEAVGLNPDTAAYTKAKPRVSAYMNEHRAAVREKLVDQEADLSRRAVEGLRKLNIGRDQILNRLWELATLTHEATRGSIAGQMKALAMIAAIEGLIPDRHRSPSATQPAAPPIQADIYPAERLREQQHQAANEEPGDPLAASKTQAAAPQPAPPVPACRGARPGVPVLKPAPKSANHSSTPNPDRNQTSPLNPFIKPDLLQRFSEAIGFAYDAVLDGPNPIRLSFPPNGTNSGRR